MRGGSENDEVFVNLRVAADAALDDTTIDDVAVGTETRTRLVAARRAADGDSEVVASSDPGT